MSAAENAGVGAGERGGASPGAEADLWRQRIAAHGLFAIRDCPEMRPLRLGARELLFLRHGETDGNLKRIYQSREIPLNATGRSQAEFAAGLLQGVGVQRIVASNMQRAQDTAAIVGAAVGVKPQPDAGFQERWFGDLIGTSSVNLNWAEHPPGGEAMGEFVRRTQAAFEAVLADEQGPRTLVIAHGGNLYVLAFGLGIDLRPDMIQNATPLAFHRDGAGWTAEVLQAQGAAQPLRHRNLGW